MRRREAAARQELRQLQIQSFSGTDNIGDVLAILQELELGQLRRAAMLCDALNRDDRIMAVRQTRLAALRATELDVRPANKRAIAKKLAEQLGGVDDAPGEWDRLFPASVIGDLVDWGNFLGIGVAEIIWSTGPKEWTPRLKVWHPQFLRWDWSTFGYKILTADGEYDLPRLDENPTGDGKWLIWCPNGYQYAWQRGLIRALAGKYVMRGWDYRDWARWNETKGMGIVKAIAPATEKPGDEDFFSAVANRGSEATILVRQGEEGNKYDVENVQDGGGAEGWKSFQAFKQALDVDIAVLINGQNLTTESPAGGSSSKSLGEVQKQVSLDRLRADAGIAVALRDQVLVPMTRYNVTPTEAMKARGVDTGDLAPRPLYMTEPPKDQNTLATAMLTTGQAVSALKAAGIHVDEAAVAEEAGIPVKTDEEIAAEKAVAMEEHQAALEAHAAAGVPPVVTNPPGGAPPPVADRPPVNPAAAKKAALRATTPAAYPRRTVAGLPIAVEHAAGTVRTWREAGPDGQTIGATKMQHDYGYIEGAMGSDGEELDVYVGPNPDPREVYVVHQLAAPDFKRHDEDKVMLGWDSADAARAAYVAHRNDGDRAIGSMSIIPVDVFRRKLRTRTGIGKIRATARPDTVAAIAALAARAQRPPKKLRSRAARDAYTDRLTRSAVSLAGRTLAVDVAGLTSVIKKAGSLKEALDHVVSYYQDKMDRDRFAALVAKVRLMSRLAGGASVHKEIAA